MQKKKINKTYLFKLLMLLIMLDKPHNLAPIGKWRKGLNAQTKTK